MTATTDKRNQRDSNVVTHNGDTSSTSVLASIGVLLAGIVSILVADALLRSPGHTEQAVKHAVQAVEFPLMDWLLVALGSVATTVVFVAIWAGLTLYSGVRRWWGSVVALVLAPSVAVLSASLAHLIANPLRPETTMVEQTSRFVSILTSPPGQISAVILLAGIAVMLFASSRSRRAQLTIATTAFAPAAVVYFGHIWAGTLWPSEATTTASIAILLLIPLVWAAGLIYTRLTCIPLISAAPVPHREDKPHAHALTSTILFNGDTVSKIYRPGFLPRAIYWLAFQAEFPYMRNRAALNAAVHRRNLIGQLTEYWYGTNHVARAIDVNEVNGRLAITSEFIRGSEPSDRDHARAFLVDLVARFEKAGLPTWQIDPLQPRALDNVMEAEDGGYRVVDLESGLVSPMASIRTWIRAFRRAQVPIYDDLFFDVTRSYVQNHEAAMRAKLGDDWVRELYDTLEATESETQAWHDSEPRIWSRLLGRKRQRTPDDSVRQHWAIDWFDAAIRRWREEGNINGAQARTLQHKIRSPQFIGIMPHFGVHLSTGILLRFPLGSIARSGYTMFNLGRVTWKFLTRRIDRDEWREAASIHSPLVIAAAAAPGVGVFAYLASRPILTDHLLLRIGLDAVLLKFPTRLYQQSGVRWLVTNTPGLTNERPDERREPRGAAPLFGWYEEHRAGEIPDSHRSTLHLAAGYSARGIV